MTQTLRKRGERPQVSLKRRIRTRVLFELPGETERAQIWKAQLHPRTPLAPDVDFAALAHHYEVSGGDIQNAVLKLRAPKKYYPKKK